MKRILLSLTALVALALVVLSGCGGAAAQRELLASSAPSSMTESTSVMSAAETPETRAPKAAPPTDPTRLRLGDIDAPIVSLALNGSSLAPPENPRILGWWGKRAGSRHGTTLLTGHTVHDGGGTFDDLEHVPEGTRARLNGHSYQVKEVEVISKDELAQRAPALFAQTGRPKLILVTCEDYDPVTGHYASNVVVTLDTVM